MAADLVYRDRRETADGGLVEGRIWAVPVPVPPSPHRFKYSLVYIVAGRRIVGYDNERGKGDHRHYRDTEEPYTFTTIRQLLADFLNDVRDAGGKL